MKTAFVFPGQGAQKVGMGGELRQASAAARAVFEEADAALGESLTALILDGPAETLTLTANTQPAILAVSVAALRAFEERSGFQPDFVAGHSLGEFSALVCSGALGLADAVRTTRARGTFMQEAVPAGQGAMAAVMGRQPDEIAAACERAAEGEVVAPANFNSPDQTVISGAAAAVERASRILAGAGAKVIPLKVSAPFHCELMRPAAERLDDFLAGVAFTAPRMPVVANVTAAPNMDAARIRELLVRQVTSPVRWTDTVRFLQEQGVRRFVEFGPGNVLAGLIRKIDREVEVVSAGAPEGISKALSVVEAG
jgi:[acyl-carrier-protein] S-malonyltransferase